MNKDVTTVLVTGGSGFIGYHLVKELVAHKCRVLILDNLGNSHKAFVDENKEIVLLHRKDIRNKAAVNDIFKPEHIDACIHLAAKTDVRDYRTIIRPEETVGPS